MHSSNARIKSYSRKSKCAEIGNGHHYLILLYLGIAARVLIRSVLSHPLLFSDNTHGWFNEAQGHICILMTCLLLNIVVPDGFSAQSSSSHLEECKLCNSLSVT